MGYLHIQNMYRPEGQVILLFKECYALEKIHGTSAHITFDPATNKVGYFSGGESYPKFVALFNEEFLTEKFKEIGVPPDRKIIVYGEAYGGRQQGMSHTYGPNLKFIVFDVKIGDNWLDVPNAESISKKLGLEFVDYVKIPTDLKLIDGERDKPSTQAIRNGVTTINADGSLTNPRLREGVVVRPLIEVTLNNGDRVICKHKGDAFKETATPRPVVDPAKLQVLEEANAVATEWCVPTRLEHVLDKIPEHSMEKMRDIINAMIEDIFREGKGEIVESESVKKAIGKRTVELYKNYLNSQIK